MSTTSKRACVIGAGASGLVAAKELLEAGCDVVILERGGTTGGMWSPQNDCCKTYDSLLSNTSGEAGFFA
jgi:cation diffusion facilitator CzcD-associated flavoprotein CzcO